jgi:hypothetical protein
MNNNGPAKNGLIASFYRYVLKSPPSSTNFFETYITQNIVSGIEYNWDTWMNPKQVGQQEFRELSDPPGVDYWSAQFNGFLKVDTAGTYVFHYDGDDKSNMIIDDSSLSGLLDDNFSWEYSKYLSAGVHSIAVNYVEFTGAARIVLKWKKPGDADFSIIPTSNYFYRVNSSRIQLMSLRNELSLNPTPATTITIVTPKDTVLSTPKPKFLWSVALQTSDLSSYQLQLQKKTSALDSSVTAAGVNYTYDLTPGDVSIEAGPTENRISYTLNDFQLLGSGDWLWRIGGNFTPTGNTGFIYSDSAAFRIEPDLEMSNVLNYPNPFAAHTRIRYKLSKDADEVKIYIFNLAGQLVRDLDGDTTGTTVLKEYNDIFWDGTNGLGEPVNNGVYPFKIVAKLGNGKVEGRGKMVRLR